MPTRSARVVVAAVGHGVDALGAQPLGDAVGVADGEAVDDAANRAASGMTVASQARRSAGSGRSTTDRREALALERAAEHLEVVAELLDDVGDDAVVGRRRGAQHRARPAAAAASTWAMRR